jgi:hypothetical protein
VGARTLARAQRLVHQVVEVLAPGGVPRLLTDGLKDYRPALLTHIGHGLQAPRRSPAGGRCPTCAMPYTMEEEKRGNIRVESWVTLLGVPSMPCTRSASLGHVP